METVDERARRLSVIFPVYWGDRAEYTKLALKSVIHQTFVPHEVIVLRDGPVTDEVDRELRALAEIYPTIIRELRLPENHGLGTALNIGIKEASHEIVARMDADDLSSRTRFERQMNVLVTDPDLALIGSQIREFVHVPGDLARTRRVPTEEADIRRYAKLRNPINHVSVMYRKSCVLDAGNYLDAPGFEDYHLWIRMLLRGHRLRNLDEALVDVRVPIDLFRRRGGLAYLGSELNFLRTAVRWGWVTPVEALTRAALGAGIRMAPNGFRQTVYTRLLRR